MARTTFVARAIRVSWLVLQAEPALPLYLRCLPLLCHDGRGARHDKGEGENNVLHSLSPYRVGPIRDKERSVRRLGRSCCAWFISAASDASSRRVDLAQGGPKRSNGDKADLRIDPQLH